MDWIAGPRSRSLIGGESRQGYENKDAEKDEFDEEEDAKDENDELPAKEQAVGFAGLK